MTDHHHPESQVPERDRPTRAQLRYLRSLAMQADQTFASPRTKTHATHEITRLQRAARASRGERQHRHAYDQQDYLAGATAIRDETTGYGITARWA